MSASVLTPILLVMCLTATATVNLIVRPEQNVTLTCDLNSSSVVAWYRLSADNIHLLIFAERGKLQQSDFIVDHNENQSRFGLAADENLQSVRLEILGLTESDLGLYYCAIGASAKSMRFGTAVRLALAASPLNTIGMPSSICLSSFGLTVSHFNGERSSSRVGGGTLWAGVAGGICGFLCGFLCACAFCHRGGSSAISCVKESSNVQVQYSSLRFIRRSRTPTVPADAPGNVTYATVAKHST